MSKDFRIKKINFKTKRPRCDWTLLGLILILTVFGVIMVGNASVIEAQQNFGNKFYLFRLQARWALVGILTMTAALFFDYRRLKKIAAPFQLVTLFLLGIVLLPKIGTQIMGARRWLGFGGFNFQPSELVKLSFILYLSAHFSQKKKIWPLLVLGVVILTLIMLEPDLGTAIIICATSVIVYFISGAPILAIGGIGILGILGGIVLIAFSPYRRERVMTFLNLSRDPLGASYHVRQILIAIGSGGIFGLGLGQSRQKFEYLPAVTTDSIFAVIGEELGFVGASIVVFIFLFLIWRGIKIAANAPDEFGKLLAVGITSWIGLQAMINLAAMVALVPLTGVPLPFISYGGSSLVIALTGIGILLNISRQKTARR